MRHGPSEAYVVIQTRLEGKVVVLYLVKVLAKSLKGPMESDTDCRRLPRRREEAETSDGGVAARGGDLTVCRVEVGDA